MNRNIFTQWLRFGVTITGAWIFLAGGAILLPQSASVQTLGMNISTDALQIEPVKSNDVAMSPEFRVAIYENLVEEVTKAGGFQHVYRSGDRRATKAPGLLILRSKVEGFKHGSEKEREVTTVAGWTVIKTDVQLVARDGRVLIDRQVEGKVRLFGGNLKATRDLAKKVARLIRHATERHAMNTPRDLGQDPSSAFSGSSKAWKEPRAAFITNRGMLFLRRTIKHLMHPPCNWSDDSCQQPLMSLSKLMLMS
jgi:hypothetical protein